MWKYFLRSFVLSSMYIVGGCANIIPLEKEVSQQDRKNKCHMLAVLNAPSSFGLLISRSSTLKIEGLLNEKQEPISYHYGVGYGLINPLANRYQLDVVVDYNASYVGGNTTASSNSKIEVDCKPGDLELIYYDFELDGSSTAKVSWDLKEVSSNIKNEIFEAISKNKKIKLEEFRKYILSNGESKISY